jgi:hypothetical protein
MCCVHCATLRCVNCLLLLFLMPLTVLGGHDSRKGSLLPSGPSGWLRKSRPALKQSGGCVVVVGLPVVVC